MKNYSLNKNHAKTFILNYVVINNFIIVNYANGDIEEISYSIENEMAILEKMKYQVLNCRRFSNILNNKFELFSKLLINEVLIFVALIVAIGLTPNPSLIPVIVAILSSVAVISFTLYKVCGYQKLRNDIKKQFLFLNNEDHLNSVLRNNKDVRQNLKETSLTKASERRCGEFLFTLNTIDNINYGELRQLYEQTKQIINNNDIKVLKRKK